LKENNEQFNCPDCDAAINTISRILTCSTYKYLTPAFDWNESGFLDIQLKRRVNPAAKTMAAITAAARYCMETSHRFMNRAAYGLITGRPEKLIMGCALCGAQLPHPEYARRYPNLVCAACDGRAVTQAGEPAKGANPVFIDGKQCWRRYRFGSYLTMLDDKKCKTIVEFFEKNE
jgi:hypothetical protein